MHKEIQMKEKESRWCVSTFLYLAWTCIRCGCEMTTAALQLQSTTLLYHDQRVHPPRVR